MTTTQPSCLNAANARLTTAKAAFTAAAQAAITGNSDAERMTKKALSQLIE